MIFVIFLKCKFSHFKKNMKKREMWCKSWLLRKSELGVIDTLLEELRTESVTDYKNFIIKNVRSQFH